MGFPLFHGVLGKGLALSHSLFVNLLDIQTASYVRLLGSLRYRRPLPPGGGPGAGHQEGFLEKVAWSWAGEDGRLANREDSAGCAEGQPLGGGAPGPWEVGLLSSHCGQSDSLITGPGPRPRLLSC